MRKGIDSDFGNPFCGLLTERFCAAHGFFIASESLKSEVFLVI